MDLRDLTADEDVVLLGFLDEIISADADFSNDEQRHVAALQSKLGKERVDIALAGVSARAPSRSKLEAAARAVTRPEARAAILAFLYEVARSDGLNAAEEEPLRWLASIWK